MFNELKLKIIGLGSTVVDDIWKRDALKKRRS